MKKLETETIKKFQDTTDNALLKDDDKSELSIPKSNERILALTKKLEENVKLAKVDASPEVKGARDAVIKCLKENSGRTLNCWDEVSEFKKLVDHL